MIYSLLGLHSGAPLSHIRSDYTKPCWQVYAPVTQRWVEVGLAATMSSDLKTSHPLSDILMNKTWRYDDVPNLPSWAINFKHTIHFQGFSSGSVEELHWPGKRKMYRRPLEMDWKRKELPMTHFCSASVLRLIGVSFDSIARIYKSKPPKDGKWTLTYGMAGTAQHDLWSEIRTITEQRRKAAFRRRYNSCIPMPPLSFRNNFSIDCPTIRNCPGFIGEIFHLWSQQQKAWPSKSKRDNEKHDEHLDYFFYLCEQDTGDVNMFITSLGFIGFAPASVKEGDQIILSYCSAYPMILRPTGNFDAGMESWTFPGFAWIHGIMEGELLEALHGKKLVEERFEVV
jgi:hypothetical protein